MAGFMFPGLLADWTDGMDPQDPRTMPQGLLAALSQGQGADAPMSNSPQMGGSSPTLGSGGFNAPMSINQPTRAPQAYDDPFGGDPRFNRQPAPVNGMPMPAIPGPNNPIPSFQPQPDTEQKGGFLEGSPAYQAYANSPSPNAQPAGGAPFNAPKGKDEPGTLEKLTGVLGGIYGQGGPGDGLINLGLALMSPGNKAENLMRAGQMAQMNDYKKSQLLAAQQKQQREMLALQGNMETLKKAYPEWSPTQLAAAAQNPALVQEAVKISNPSEVYRPMTADERAKFGISDDNKNTFAMGRDGKPVAIGTPSTTVNIDQKGESSFATAAGQAQATRFNGYVGGADKAQAAMGDINNLREISRRMGSQGSSADFKRMIGPYAEAAGVPIEGLSDIQAYNSVIQKLAPQMHAPGSGSTSDIEFKGMLSALPQLSSNPAAREAILNTMEAQQRHAMTQGEIATKVLNGEMTRADGEKALRALPDPMTAFRTFRAQNPDAFASAPQGGGNPAATSQQQAAPPVPGARQAADGHFYVSDPNRPGKYLKVQ